MKGLILVVLVLAFQADISADGKVIHGDLWTGDNWHFLARFCFLSLHGKFDYEIQVGNSSGMNSGSCSNGLNSGCNSSGRALD